MNLLDKQRKENVMKPELFWSNVTIGGEDDCWPYDGIPNSSGYIYIYDEGLIGVHVYAYKNKRGRVSEYVCVLHHCDNRICCNPKHLWLGTKSDNSQDCWAKGRNIFQTNPELRPKGENHANAKLTAEQVAEIRKRYNAGNVKQVTLAKEFNVSQRTISLITRGESYK